MDEHYPAIKAAHYVFACCNHVDIVHGRRLQIKLFDDELSCGCFTSGPSGVKVLATFYYCTQKKGYAPSGFPDYGANYLDYVAHEWYNDSGGGAGALAGRTPCRTQQRHSRFFLA